jgi:hypothetical protein
VGGGGGQGGVGTIIEFLFFDTRVSNIYVFTGTFDTKYTLTAFNFFIGLGNINQILFLCFIHIHHRTSKVLCI